MNSTRHERIFKFETAGGLASKLRLSSVVQKLDHLVQEVLQVQLPRRCRLSLQKQEAGSSGMA